MILANQRVIKLMSRPISCRNKNVQIQAKKTEMESLKIKEEIYVFERLFNAFIQQKKFFEKIFKQTNLEPWKHSERKWLQNCLH